MTRDAEILECQFITQRIHRDREREKEEGGEREEEGEEGREREEERERGEKESNEVEGVPRHHHLNRIKETLREKKKVRDILYM